MARTLANVEEAIGTDAFQRRLARADVEAAAFDAVLRLIEGGMGRSSALRSAFPDDKLPSLLRRLRLYESEGRDGLVSRRYGRPAPRKMTPEVRGGLRVLALSDPKAGSLVLAQRLGEMFETRFGATVVQGALRELGLARRKGRRWASEDTECVAQVEPLALAGAEMLCALDEHCGAISSLTAALGERLAALPEPLGEVLDDRANRDEYGRFTADYNQARPRLEPELGHRFNSVEHRRESKDLTAMRVVADSVATRHRKNLALVMLPCVVRGGRWSELQHWRGGQLGELTGFAYSASTLDKYLRELKLAGCGESLRDALAAFWLAEEGATAEPITGAVVVYADTSLKPLWTSHWTRAAKVSKTGRVQPAISTVTLHSGAGTPLLSRSFSGRVSLPQEVLRFLDEYERHAGEGTARRVIVMDREAHSVSLFKTLDPKWGFIIPLRRNVLGPNAKFSDVTPWEPFGEGPDEVCDAKLLLNDRRAGEEALLIRVVGRRRHRTGKVAWFATNVASREFGPSDVVRIYFERWPAQERVYRDGNEAVGLGSHHGYGKRKVDNVAVIDRIEKLEGQSHRLRSEQQILRERREDLCLDLEAYQEALERTAPRVREDRERFESALLSNVSTPEHQARLRESYRTLRVWEEWVESTQARLTKDSLELASVDEQLALGRASVTRKESEAQVLMKRRRIFTVDVELDDIMMAYKLTFINLCNLLMKEYLGVAMEIETLIEAVLTLPGQRVRTAETETIRLFRQPRDPRVLAAAERATAKLTALGLTREGRRLIFEVVDAPEAADLSDP